MGKPKVLGLAETDRLALERGFRFGEKHCFRMHCRVVLLKSEDLSSVAIGAQTEMSHVSVNAWVKRFKSEGIEGVEDPFRTGQEAHHGLLGRRGGTPCNRAGQTECEQSQGSMGASLRQRGKRRDVQTFLSALAQDISV